MGGEDEEETDRDIDEEDGDGPRQQSVSEDDGADNIEEDLPSKIDSERSPPPATKPKLHSTPLPPPQHDYLSLTLKKAREEEHKKGKAVSRQLVCVSLLCSIALKSLAPLGNI